MKASFHLIDHPLLKHKLGYLRDQRTQSNEFRELTKEVSRILAYEAMRGWVDFDHVEVDTPVARAKIQRIINPPVVVSVMRAGNGMLDAVLSMIPFASAGFIGIYRDKFIHSTVEYYFKMPQNIGGKIAILCDPLVATGDTAIAAIERLKSHDVKKIQILSLLISQTELERLQRQHPDVEIFSLGLEEELNANGFLVPGLGDSGDRLYQTR
jgi:uracil phosphoribosyltransferase